ETYCTIFSFSESPKNKDILWAGSDDGLVHVTRDGGKTWSNVTPKNLPNGGKPALISIIEAGHYSEGTAYIAATRYKSADDRMPYLLKTTNYGASWEFITKGIPELAYTRVIREDPQQQGLLFAGTEIGMFVSTNDGNTWMPLQNNLPRTPIHDIAIHQREGDLVIATHGRSFWIMDDITPLRSIASKEQQYASNQSKGLTLFKPRLSWRMDGGSWYSPTMQTGENLPNGVMVYYHWDGSDNKPITMQFRDAKDSLLREFSSDKDMKGEKAQTESIYHTEPGKEIKNAALPLQKGLNRIVWDMHTAPALESPVVMWGASTRGPKVIPGTYSVSLKKGDSLIGKQSFDIASAIGASTEDLKLQYDLHVSVNEKVTETHKAVNRIKDMKSSINQAIAKMKKEVKDTAITKDIIKLGNAIADTLSAIDQRLVQNKAKAGQDLLNHPMKLNNKLAALTSTIASADAKPTEQTYQAVKHIVGLIQRELDQIKGLELVEIKKFNEQFTNLKLPVIGAE
ncbi:MAG: WD40/YVTN/BNR-like repeat-containing protein, partial [Candidatus Kapaibacteriota bacterium]